MVGSRDARNTLAASRGAVDRDDRSATASFRGSRRTRDGPGIHGGSDLSHRTGSVVLAETVPCGSLLHCQAKLSRLRCERSPTGGGFFYTDDIVEVRGHFEQYPWVAVIEGDLPAAVEELPSTGLCWVHVDLNDPAVEIESLRRLRTRLLPGAFVLFDDTGSPGYEASVDAHRQFADEIGAPLLHLPTGQALLVVP